MTAVVKNVKRRRTKMPAPIVAAGILTVARFIASKGVTQAIKKYGKKAVDEARKHVKDVTTKPTPGQKKIAPVTKSQRATRDTGRKGFIGGAAAGGAAVGAAMSDKKDAPKAKPKAKAKSSDQRTNPKDYPVYKKGSKSAKAFQEAYGKAKKNGQKTFTFEGRRYEVK